MSYLARDHVRETRWFPMADDDLSLRDLQASWPSIRLAFEFGPWHWRIRPRLYVDDITHTYVVEWLAVKAEVYGPDRRDR